MTALIAMHHVVRIIRDVPEQRVARGMIGTVIAIFGTPERAYEDAHLAGRVHPKTRVPFDKDGYPDFSAYRHPGIPDVRIELSGKRSTDFARANSAAGLKETPAGYTWHHHQDKGRMQLVETNTHKYTGHTGGFSKR